MVYLICVGLLKLTIANLRFKCVTETKNVLALFYKNLKSSFLRVSTYTSEVDDRPEYGSVDYPHLIGLCPHLNLKCSAGPDQRLSPTISEWGLFSVLLSVEIV